MTIIVIESTVNIGRKTKPTVTEIRTTPKNGRGFALWAQTSPSVFGRLSVPFWLVFVLSVAKGKSLSTCFPLPLPPFGTPLRLTPSSRNQGIHKGGSAQKGQQAREFTQPSSLAIYFATARCTSHVAQHGWPDTTPSAFAFARPRSIRSATPASLPAKPASLRSLPACSVASR